jgi:L-lactate dehydrogenase complex protein LldG
VDYPTYGDFADDSMDVLATFKKMLEEAHATWHEVSSVDEAQKIMAKQLPKADVIASASPEWKGNKDLSRVSDPRELEDVDLGIFRAQFGVAEMGSVWITNEDLQINALGFLSQHLAVLLDPHEIVGKLSQAYERIQVRDHQYGCFMMGPSATGDIELTMVYGAQGARTLTLFFLKKPSS